MIMIWTYIFLFRNGYLEIDDDFLGKVNEISVAVYQENGSLLYGENPSLKNCLI